VGVEGDDLVVDVRGVLAEVALADADDPPRRAHLAVGVPVAAGPGGFGGQRDGFAAGREPVEALVGPVGEPHDAVTHPPGGPAVLVDGGARVHAVREQVLSDCLSAAGGGPVVAPAHELGPAALGRPALGPDDVDVAVVWAVHPHLAEADGRGYDDLGRHGGGPGAEGAFDGAVGLRDRIDHHACNANGDQPRGRVTCAGR
jgi:hypothetical protein